MFGILLLYRKKREGVLIWLIRARLSSKPFRVCWSRKNTISLRDILDTMNPSDLAALLNELDEKRLPLVFRLLSKELAAEAFVEMDPEQQELLIPRFFRYGAQRGAR